MEHSTKPAPWRKRAKARKRRKLRRVTRRRQR